MPELEQQRRFATKVVEQLREAGFEAYWAGGCVRDRLLGRIPKDYDVATSAKPSEIRELFGKKRTLAIGEAFGVITVLGPKPAGMIEVTTFRQDAQYSDGRHPDRVTFSSAEEDASRRDFTVNGLFYDPLDEKIIDYVGGREDLRAKVIRAIGDPSERIAEDKLRMLRAVRFAATFDFALDGETQEAVRRMADQVTVVSPERIAMEMRRMLVDANRVVAIRLLIETGLAQEILPEILSGDGGERERSLAIAGGLREPGFPLALAALLHRAVDAAKAREVGARWKLSNKETDRTAWLIEYHGALRNARDQRWSVLQPILIAEGIADLLALHAAAFPEASDDLAFCRSKLSEPRDVLDPPPLVTGNDLRAHGVRPGPQYRTLLQQARDAQLDEVIHDQDEALALINRLLEKTTD